MNVMLLHGCQMYVCEKRKQKMCVCVCVFGSRDITCVYEWILQSSVCVCLQYVCVYV